MKVCLISGTYPEMTCGVGFHTYFLAESLAARGHQVTVITTRSDLISRHLVVQESPTLYPVIRRWNLSSSLTVRSLINELDPDVVHVQLPVRISRFSTAMLLPLLNLVVRERPLLLGLHEFSEGLLFSRLRGLLLIGSAPFVIFTNQNDLRLAVRFFPSKRNRFFHVPVGPMLPIEEVLKASKPTRDQYAIAYLGILYPRKGLETLLQAMALTTRWIPQIRLHVLSTLSADKPYHRSVRALARPLGIEENVVWYSHLGSRDIAERLVQCSISCLPYPGGATFRRTTLFEGLAAGTAVITTKTHRTPSQLVHGVNSWLVHPGNPMSLAQAIRRIVEDQPLSDRLRAGGRQLAGGFSWDSIGEQTGRVYESVLDAFERRR